MTTTHTYTTALSWTGRTDHYDTYSREHQVTLGADVSPLRLSADPAFRGNRALPNPELLLLAAASSCQLLSFLAVAARSRVEVVGYVDEATATMPEDEAPVRLTSITLRPRVTVRGADPAKVERLLHKAHEQCYVANSLTTAVVLEPTVEVQ